MKSIFSKNAVLKNPIFTRNILAKALGTLALGCAISPLASADWSVQGSQILDLNGEVFVYRGVNLGILPPADSLPQVYADIAATGANAIRIPIDNLSVTQAQVHVNLCKQHKLVCVFTHVLSDGYVDNGRAPNSLHLVDAWSRFVDLLRANEDYVVIDLASAMAGNLAWLDYYTSHYQTGIIFVRNIWGLKNQVIISGGNWGQDWSFLMRDNAETMLSYDPLKNTVLSVHMYEAYRDEQTVRSYLESYTTRNLPIIIGEFGPIKRDRYNEYRNPYTTTDVAVDAIMDISQELGVGYLGWNWSGYKMNDPQLYLPPDFAALNMVTNFDPQQVTPWGNFLINSDNGIKATAQLATHFSEVGSSASSTSSTNPISSVSSNSSASSTLSSMPISSVSSTSSASSRFSATPISSVSSTSSARPISSTSSTALVSSASSNVAKSSVGSSSSIAMQGNCRYVIQSQWDTGFTAVIRMTNTGSQPVNGWSVTWRYSDGSSITGSWNTTLSGNNPYSAKNVNWNATIRPGQTVEFGFQGRKSKGSAQIPVISGSICQ